MLFKKKLSHELNMVWKPNIIEIVQKPQNQVEEDSGRLKAQKPNSMKFDVIYSILYKDYDRQYIGRTSKRLKGGINTHEYVKTSKTTSNNYTMEH